MATLDFSRGYDFNLITKEHRLLSAVLDVTRDDLAAVDFGSDILLMIISTSRSSTPLLTLTSGVDFTVATARLTFNKILTELDYRAYHFEIYNSTTSQSVGYGKLTVK